MSQHRVPLIRLKWYTNTVLRENRNVERTILEDFFCFTFAQLLYGLSLPRLVECPHSRGIGTNSNPDAGQSPTAIIFSAFDVTREPLSLSKFINQPRCVRARWFKQQVPDWS